MSTLEEPVVSALLCDAAQVVGDKLYILGGGWTLIWPPGPDAPVGMAVAAQILIPWSMGNHRLALDVRLMTADGEPVSQEFGEARAQGQMEAGRPPGVPQGTPLAIAFALQFGALQLAHGAYVWIISLDDVVRARLPFQVAERPAGI